MNLYHRVIPHFQVIDKRIRIAQTGVSNFNPIQNCGQLKLTCCKTQTGCHFGWSCGTHPCKLLPRFILPCRLKNVALQAWINREEDNLDNYKAVYKPDVVLNNLKVILVLLSFIFGSSFRGRWFQSQKELSTGSYTLVLNKAFCKA